MRFLEEHELPDWERERRKPILQTIEMLQEEIKKHFARAEPELSRAIRRGEYEYEASYRRRLPGN